MILHTISAAPDSNAFREALAVASVDDAILLLGDGVYAALPGSAQLEKLRAVQATLFVLESDALAAGVNKPASGIQQIDMDGFVTLSERFSRQMAWF